MTEMTIADVWHPLPGFPRYSATADGRVRGPCGKELRSFVNGYRGSAVNLYRDGEMYRRGISSIKRMVKEVMERAA